jgi:ferredoxin/flavodoxin---NADP+ reductase
VTVETALHPDTLRGRHYNATLVGERIHHGNVMVIRVVRDTPPPDPKPGQWLELGLGVWEPVREGAEPGSVRKLAPDALIRRAYSLSSPILTSDHTRLAQPGDWEGFEFFLSLVVPPEERAHRVPNLTGRLFCLRPGDRLFLSDQPLGDYTLDGIGPDTDVLFLATGTGEAPHNHMIWDLLRRGHRGRIASIVSVRHRDDLAYDTVHRRLAELYPRYRYAALVTREDGGARVHLQDLLKDGLIENMAGFSLDPARVHVYLCGNPGMIGPPRYLAGKRQYPDAVGMVELLEERGQNADLRRPPVNVHYERYW